VCARSFRRVVICRGKFAKHFVYNAIFCCATRLFGFLFPCHDPHDVETRSAMAKRRRRQGVHACRPVLRKRLMINIRSRQHARGGGTAVGDRWLRRTSRPVGAEIETRGAVRRTWGPDVLLLRGRRFEDGGLKIARSCFFEGRRSPRSGRAASHTVGVSEGRGWRNTARSRGRGASR